MPICKHCNLVEYEKLLSIRNHERRCPENPTRLDLSAKFKSGELNVILLSTKYAGSGIDISYATDIIIYHKMGEDKIQAVGRGQRVGRTSPLSVHNLLYEHEMPHL